MTDPQFRPGDLLFLPLGGSDEIGMNLNLYHYAGKWLMIDLGITFADDSMPGVDVLMPDPSFIVDRRDDLVGLVLTHGHEDHIGAVPYLWERLQCRIYATPFTATLVRRKLAEAGLVDLVDLVEVPMAGLFEAGPFEIELVTLTHSIPEPNGVLLRCDAGTVLHTGDWKFDPDPQIGAMTDFRSLEAIADDGVLAMIGDSTNADIPGRTGSEAELVESFTDLFADMTKRVAVTCFASNIARLRSIAIAAERNDRHVALVGRSLWRMNAAARANGYLQDIAEFVPESDIGYFPDDRLVLICTGSQGEPRAALARIAEQSHRSVSLDRGDTVIFSSREIPGNEKAIARVQSGLASRGVNIITERDHHVHVSGHPAREELVEMYQLIRPRIAVPVHGDARRLVEHARLARRCQVPEVVVPSNGSVLRLAPGMAEVVGTVPASSLVLDGTVLRRLDSEVLGDRRRMLHNGSVATTVVLDRKGRCRGDPVCSVTGIDDGSERLNGTLSRQIRHTLDGLPPGARRTDDAVISATRQVIRKMFRAEFGKRPVTTVHVVRA